MKKFSISNSFIAIFTLVGTICFLPISELIIRLLNKVSWSPLEKLLELGFPEAPTALALTLFFLWLYINYLWKYPLFNLIHSVPNINGRYLVEIESNYNRSEKYKGFLEIHQTLTSLRVSLFTERSSSSSIIANLVKNEHEKWALNYTYMSMPKTVLDDLDMRCHMGIGIVNILKNGDQLDGDYFNNSRDRNTYGKISCKREGSRTLGHF